MDDLAQLLYKALLSPVGIEIDTNGKFNLVRARLYTIKREDPALAGLSILQSPKNPDYLWIVHREIPDNA